MTLVRLGPAGQITLPQVILAASGLKEGEQLTAEVTADGAIVLRPVSITDHEPTPDQEAEILAAVDEARATLARERPR